MKNKGITLIALVVTIVVLLILAGITIGSISNHNGIIEKTKETTQSAQRESIIEKIEADLYTEKVKTGAVPTKNKLKNLIIDKGYATEIDDDSFITKDGNFTIEYNEIIGWQE